MGSYGIITLIEHRKEQLYMEHSSDHLENYSTKQQKQEEKQQYTPRPKSHLIVAWVLIAIVIFAFLGMCYWMVAYGRV